MSKQVRLFAHIPTHLDRTAQVVPGSVWIHRNSNEYTVLDVANQHANDRKRYPLMVVYVDKENRTWAKPIGRFLAGMTRVSKPVGSVEEPVDGIELWATATGAEVRTRLGRILLVCESWDAGRAVASRMNESNLNWTPSSPTTSAHEAVLRLCLQVDGVTPGRDLMRFWEGRLF